MGRIVFSFLTVCFLLTFCFLVENNKTNKWAIKINSIKNLNNKLVFLSLVVVSVLAMVAYESIESRDIRILYSLCLVISSTVGRYGTMATFKRKTTWANSEYTGFRALVYHTMLVFGLLGLYFS